MKLIYRNTIFLFAITFSGIAYSQEYVTTESISSQLKNNHVKEAAYATVSNAKQAPVKNFEGSSLGKELKEGTRAGLKFASSVATSSAPVKKNNTVKQAALPSDMSSEQAKAVAEAEAKRSAASDARMPAMQEEEGSAHPGDKTEPPQNEKRN